MKQINLTFNPSKKTIPHALHAQTDIQRMVGLLKHSQLLDDEAMLIDSCKQVHTFFMKFPIDAIFIDKKGVIVAIEELKPWRMSWIHFKATSVIEVNLGWTRKNGIQVGSSVEIGSC